ncbi:asparagine--tRNA ligase [mine drainage metagenome]|uniref:asparagine--tRNA ligase n=1 Tax=mine drainage metagenome TaxID=410659 RepID=A0A1J5SUB1_9ZZZZ
MLMPPVTKKIKMFNKRTKIKQLLQSEQTGHEVTVMGWVRTFRNNQFIALNDGSTNNNLQVVVELGLLNDTELKRITTGASIKVEGIVVASVGKGQTIEVKAKNLEVLGDSDAEKYPLQPKKHSLEFLREKAHLRFRTNTFGSVFRIRHSLAYAIHKFFNDKGFVYLHTPIITASDAEGAGEMFRVTTLPIDGTAPKNEDGSINFKEDFFGKSTNLTVSGQLEGELGAMAFSEIYTFGPTFRAENSNTTRHLAEFWMIEPEMAFFDIEDNMNLAEEFIKYLIQYAMDNNREDIEFLSQRLAEEEKQLPQDKRSELGLVEKLEFVLNNAFERITYTEAIDILLNSPAYKKKKFQYEVKWGIDLQSEHERYLVEKHFKKPVIVTGYPAAIKAFYMRMNDDGKTVAAMDILAPGIGEIVGGSQREERLEKLEARMKDMHIPAEEMSWYLDTRRFGTVPHAGFGLGFERMVQFVTGMTNIRDVIAFARTPKNCEF